MANISAVELFPSVTAGGKMAKKLINSNVSIKRSEVEKKKQSDSSSSINENTSKPKRKINKSASIKQEGFYTRVIPPKKLKISESDLFLISRDAIPEKLLKILKVKEALYRGEALTVKDALEEFEVTNNYYQKYKNSIIPFYEATNGKIFTLLFETESQENALADIVSLISKHLGNILTLNQGFPINDTLNINLSFDTTLLNINPYELFSKLRNVKGVRYMEIMGRINNTFISKRKKD